ncbi:MAG: hypothetical protein FVQ85_18350 [Planctomycetes bacterium]|nr:hypothetical protein [Planctomycetota bacterium]
MSKESEHKTNIITAVSLLDALMESGVQDDFEIWLSSDEEGNEFLPMPVNPELSLAINGSRKRVVFFPSHRRFLSFFSPQPF